MDKIISFGKGIRRQPSIGEDGELSELVNLIPKNGELVNVRPMEEVGVTVRGILLAVHKVGDAINYITWTKISLGGSTVYDLLSNGVLVFSTSSEIKSAIVIGNTLVVGTSDGLKYAIWKNDSYVWLDGLPKLNVKPYLTTERLSLSDLNDMFDTDLGATTSRVLSGDEGVVNSTLLKELKSSPINNSIKLYGETRQKVYERVFSVVNQYKSQLTRNGYFCAPFYVRFAYRMYDGSHIKHTAPILLTPNTWGKPIIEVNINDDGSSTFEPIFLASKLSVNIDLPPELAKWEGLITHIDVFVSEEIVDYTDSPESLLQIEIAPYWGVGEGTDSSGNPTIVQNLFPENGPQMMYENMWRPLNYARNISSTNYLLNSVTYKGGETIRFYKEKVYDERYLAIENTGSTIKLLNMTSKRNSVIEPDDIAPSKFGLEGNYDIYDLQKIIKSQSILLQFKGNAVGYNIRGPYEQSEYTPSLYHIKMERVGDESYHNHLRTASDYRKISEYELENIGFGVGEFNEDFISNIEGEVPLVEGVLSKRAVQSALSEIGNSNHEIIPSYITAYNSRLNIVASEVLHRESLSLLAQNPCKSTFGVTISKAYVTLFKNGQYAYIEIPTEKLFLADILYFAYHDGSALTLTMINYHQDGSNKYEVQLQRHQTLNISYAFNNYRQLDFVMESSNETIKVPANPRIKYDGLIFLSNAAQPFIIDESNSISLPSDIIHISTAAKALSPSQFGQFPLYAFCKDGIWALEIANDGTYLPPKIVSNDICNNSDSITQIESSVVFTTDQGLKLIQGSEVALLSATMNGHNINEKTFFPDEFFGTYNEAPFDMLVQQETRDFRTILSTCKIAYDYPNRLLRIFPEGEGKWYVYSLDTREFACEEPLGVVNAVVAGYPTPLVQIGTTLYTFGNEVGSNTLRDGLLLTRPIDMGEPFAMKKLQDMKLHYTKHNKEKGAFVKMVVYVSNDGEHWYVLPSMRKRAFKYYRVALITKMTDNDALSGMIMRYELERTNKIR